MSGSRLTVPEPVIELYQDGFEAKEGGVSNLGRAEDGKKLSDLVEKIAEPMVIAVDAPWGAGKSVFLKCWVGEHIKEEHGNKATTVYFDAFQHDFLDDPLIALTGVITERFEKVSSRSKKWKPVKEAASKLVRPAARIGLALATAGASEAAGVIVDAGLAAGSKELEKASDEFWKKEDGKRAAMQSFRDALEHLAAEQKLVIVVDELDRCRPDYALNLLEVIKHFFNVPNVHFVLGVNLTELENSVRARYGAGVNAGLYLQKFVHVTMHLNESSRVGNRKQITAHFENVGKLLSLSENQTFTMAKRILQTNKPKLVSLRTIERIGTSIKVSNVEGEPQSDNQGLYILRAALIIIKEGDKALYRRILERKEPKEDLFEEVAKFFMFEPHPKKMKMDAIGVIWASFVWTLQIPKSLSQIRQDPSTFPPKGEVIEGVPPFDILQTIANNEIDLFELNI